MTWSGYDKWKRNVLRRCLNIASDGADCHVWWKTVQEGGTRYQKSPLADGRDIEQWYCKLAGGSRPEYFSYVSFK